ncbi:BTAD domain-containing putative transcriptional regulator [Streptomyces sp. NPDC048659]|uniref:AfsR/SARP family transcriptional regulator n=1 Tax=Streptomyces sp. NPDC048659 TaxID=3155489 RepID=UPI003446D3D0
MQPLYRILGPAQALRPDGTAAALNGARLRALLTALAAAGGRPVRTDALIDQVWGEEGDPAGYGGGGPGAGATAGVSTGAGTGPGRLAALQALVGRLRRALGAAAVASEPGGYRLVVTAPEDIDYFRFERNADAAARELDAGRPGRAAELLDEALELWRGPALADLPGHDTDPLAVRAEHRRTRARRDRLAAAVALGEARDAVAPLAELAAEHPLDEPLQALHLRALRAAGRPAEALAAYETVRGTLAERLGTDPGPELRALYEELLTGTAPGPTQPPAHGAGPHPTPLPNPHPLPTPNPRPALPLPLTSFLGREKELSEVAAELVRTRLVTLLGPGGVGKTRLAMEAARGVEAGAEREVWVAELAAVRAESEVPAAVLTAFGARETQLWSGPALADGKTRDPLAALVEHCARRRMLLVLDNCEHVVGAVAELVEVLLARCPGVTVLATSREPLGVPGEVVRPVGPLPVEAAVRLFGERGAAVRPGFRVEEERGAAEEIVRRLDGLPLAVELAAARLRVLSAGQIAERLDDRFRLLSSGARTVLPRQQTLRAVVDWSWELLDEEEREVLRRLSVFTGGCDLDAAEAVCGGGGGAPEVLDVLGALVDKSLVVAVPGERGMRYRLLETVAEYASERLDEAGDRAAAERRHLTYYRELARLADPELRTGRQASALARLETEHDNIRGALRTAVREGEEQEALCLVHAMSWFWQLRNHQLDARTWARAAAGLGPDPFAEVPVRPAGPFPGRCTDVPPPWTGERLWEARRGGRLFVLATEGGEGSGGASVLERPETRARLAAVVAAYRPGLPQTCRQPGAMWYFARLMTGGFTGLDETLAALVAAARAHGDDWDVAFDLLLRAKLLGAQPGDAEEALGLFEAEGDSWGIAESLAARGETYERAGRSAEAAADFARAMDAAARLGAHSQVPVFKALLAAVRLRTREAAEDPEVWAEAERLLAEAAEEAGDAGTEAVSTARLLLTQHYGNTGRTDLSRAQLELMEGEFDEDTPGLFRGMTGGLRGWLACVDGAYEEASAHLRLAVREMEVLAYLVAPYLIVAQFAPAAWAHAGTGTPERGARLLGAYDTHRTGSEGAGFRPYTAQTETTTRTHAEAALRKTLGEGEFRALYEEGATLSVREAAELL